MNTVTQPDAWLRGPLPGIPAVLMPSAHALVQAREDLRGATEELTAAQLYERPSGAASVGFHLRHIAGALDRLLTYAEGGDLSEQQRAALAVETHDDPTVALTDLLARVDRTIDDALARLGRFDERDLLAKRGVGARKLPSTVLGLLFHGAEHTMRHTGQVIVTAQVVRGD